MSIVVWYELQGDEDDPETGVKSSFELLKPLPPRGLTLMGLRRAFPFLGTFHFRLRIGDKDELCSYLWLDLPPDGTDILELAHNFNGDRDCSSIHIKVLPLDFGDPSQLDESHENAFAGVGVVDGSSVFEDNGSGIVSPPGEVRGDDGGGVNYSDRDWSEV